MPGELTVETNLLKSVNIFGVSGEELIDHILPMY